MTTEKNIERYLWISAVMFVTYLLLNSFIISKNFLELGYLIILYTIIIINKIKEKRK
jgi:predicted membrane protein